jgi:16S rRNA pseudouridine516 synthase
MRSGRRRKEPKAVKSPLVPLHELLSSRGYCKRRELRSELGRVCVSGREPWGLDEIVDPTEVTWDGQGLDPETVVVLLHKTTGSICSRRGVGAQETRVFDLLGPPLANRQPALSCVGRLDRDTTGVLLLTDDGQLLHRLTSPNFKMPKIYRVDLIRKLGPEAEAALAAGMSLPGDDEPLLPAHLTRLGPRQVLLEIVEGRYHQVKRTFAALGNQVVGLHRVRFAGIELGALPLGEHRLLSTIEVAALRRSVRM